MKTSALLIAMVISGCAHQRHDPCSTASSGEACWWAGTGEGGLNRENPNEDRILSVLNAPTKVVFGHDGRGYVVDWNNHMVRRVETDQTLRVVIGTIAEGDGDPAKADETPKCAPQGALGTTVSLNHPTQAQFGPDGLLYVAAWHNNKLRTLDPATGIVKVVAGDYYGFSGDGGPACQAVFNQPSSLSFAPDGSMFVADQRNVRIRAISPDTTIVTMAGDGHEGNIGDGGPAMLAEFGWDTVNTPQVSGSVLVVDHTLYVADTMNNRIRRIDLTSGIITTVVGDGTLCDVTAQTCPNKAAATAMELNTPYGVSFDAHGNMFVADTYNNRIVEVLR